MTGEELFDLLLAQRMTVEQVARLDFADIWRQIAEARQAKPDPLGLSDVEIARRIVDYAQSRVDNAAPRPRSKTWAQIWDDCWNWTRGDD